MSKGFTSRNLGPRVLGLAGSMVLASGLAAAAQEAAPAPAAAPAPSCSGLFCLLAPHAASEQAAAEPQPRQAPQPRAAPTDAQVQPVADQGADAAEPAPRKATPKPVRAVTIAADASQVARMKTLASTMPREKIKIVAEKAADPDFAVETAFDQTAGKARARLFTEQMHIVAGESIHAIGDLAGKVVSFGADHGPTQIAARRAFAALGVAVKETPLDLDNALDGLATGDVDAVVVLAPQPIARLTSLKAPGLHFVSWPEGASVPVGAVASSIDGRDYPGIAKPGETIPAMGVDAVLTTGPKGARAPGARAFLAALAQHSTALSRRGFDLLRADLEARSDRRVASAERR